MRLGRALLVAGGLAAVVAVAQGPRREFRVPAGDAAATLAEFARQSGEQIVYLVDNVRGQRTRAVTGEFASFSALQRMLGDSGLIAMRDPATGAMTVARRPERPVREFRRPAPEQPAPLVAADEVVTLSEFAVSDTRVDRYRAADAISAVRVRTSLLTTPGSVSVVTRDLIDDLAPTRLFDVTRYLAGVQEGRGIQFSDRQIIRGFESNGRTVDNFFQTGADNFDEALIDRIEVSKGPNAILAPAGVPGGSINVITKSPEFIPRRALTLLAGRFDAQKATLDFTGPLDAEHRLAYRVVAAVQDSRRYWAADARLRGRVFAPMLTWRPAPDTQVTAKLLYARHWIFREPGLILDPAVGYASGEPRLAPGFAHRSRNGIQPWSHVGTETWDALGQLTTRIDEHLSLRVAANARHYFEDSMQEFFSTPALGNRYDPSTGVLTPDHTWALDPATGTYVATLAPFFDPTNIPVRGDRQETTVTTFNAQADLAARYEFGPVASQTVLGGGVGHFDNVGRIRHGTLPGLDLTQPDRRTDPDWAADLAFDWRGKQNTWQAYVNQRLGFLGDRLMVHAGLMQYDVYARNLNKADPLAQASVLDGSRTLWLAGVLMQPRDGLALYYTRSTNSTPVIANDLPLWRDGRQHEFGLKQEFFSQRLALNAAWFRIDQTNVTVPNPDRQTDLTAPEQLIANLGDHGYEFELTGGLTPRLSIVASYTQLRLRDSLGRRVRAVADRNAALLLSYRLLDGDPVRLSVFAGATHAGERPGDATSGNFTELGVVKRQSFLVPARTLLHLGASCRWGDYQFRLNVENVADEKDYLSQGGGRVSGTGLTSATGRNVRLSVTRGF